MTTTRRWASLVGMALVLVLGLSAVTNAADAYPPGKKAVIKLSSSRLTTGSTLTITGKNFLPKHHVVITIVCRSGKKTSTYTTSFGTRASGGTFSKTITISSSFPTGRCRVTATTGKKAKNSDSATFYVNRPGPSHNGGHAQKVKLAGFTVSGLTTAGAGSGGGLGALLVGGFMLMFLLSGGALLLTGRRRGAVSRS